MTKIKNTKKGMAKKTLSISLAVAMLATSNVPVWAAEDLFTDGDVAVEAFTSEEAPAAEEVVEAPVVEEAEAPVIEEAEVETANEVVEKGDLILDNVKVTDKVTFGMGQKVTVEGSISYRNDGEVKPLDNYKFAWRVKGESTNIFTDEVGAGNTTEKMSFIPDFEVRATDTGIEQPSGALNIDWSAYAGKTLELVVFNNENPDNININPTVIGETTIEKCAISGTLNLSKMTIQYNGKDFYFTTDTSNTEKNAVTLAQQAFTDVKGDETPGNATSTWNAANVLKFFDVSASHTARNAGEKLIVTATAKADSPYVGTIYTAKELTVNPKPYEVGDLYVELNEGISYPYTGTSIAVDTAKVSLKESNKLAGADVSSAIVSAATNGHSIGAHEVNVTINKKLLKNFSFQVPEENWILTTSVASDANKVTITQRDLENDCKIYARHDGKVLDKTTISDFIKNDLAIEDKDGTDLKDILVLGKDYVVTVYDSDDNVVTDAFKNIGSRYTIKVTAKVNSVNPEEQTCIRGQEVTVYVTDNIIDGVSYSNKYAPSYTGEAIVPSQKDFGTLTIKGLDGKDVSFQSDQWELTGNFTNNINAATYYDNGSWKTRAYAEAKILGTSSYAGQTVQVPFEIQPLTVSESTVTVPATVTYNQGYDAASDYKVQLIVTAKDAVGKVVKGLSAEDYSVKYEYENGAKSATAEATNELHDRIKATITINNTNFMGKNGLVKKIVMNSVNKQTEIVEKAITSDMIKINPSSYTYTGGNIVPTFVVMDGALVLYDEAEYGDKGEYKVVSIVNNLNVGKGKVTVAGIEGKYSGTASAEFDITPANIADVKVSFTEDEECLYTGRQVRPRTFKATLNGNDVTKQFEITGYGENISGKGTVELKPVDGNKNFTGDNLTVDFNIIKDIVAADLKVYNANGADVTEDYRVVENSVTFNTGKTAFDFDGTAKTFANAVLKNITSEGISKPTAADLEIKYAENISGKNTGMKDSAGNSYNIAYVYAVAKDGTGFAGKKEFTLADGTKIKGVVDYVPFAIKNVKFVKENVSVKNATYAGGLPVKPEVLVQINGNTLVEGVDYKLELTDTATNHFTNVTDGKIFKVTVIGINGYAGSEVKNVYTWGIDKKDLKDCDVKVVNGVTTVMNGYIPVPVTEYTSTKNEDGTYTVAAVAASKNYVGSVTVKAEGQTADEKPAAPMISKVDVNGNNAKVILSGDCEGAEGYDYVISTDKDCITNKDYAKVNKNKLLTNTNFTYVDQDVYYAYCHAYKRDENGKKIFSDWSEPYAFVVSAITPETPVVTSVKVKGSTVTVTYTEAANADGYDVVLGSAVKTVADEKRPVEYGTLVKKNIKKGVVTATFKNVPKGTYYAGLHAWNRTNPKNNTKVFSPWSNTKKVTVK